MTTAARNAVWGLNAGQVQVRACWSGYVNPAGQADALPAPPNTFTECTIGNVDPRRNPNAIDCPPPLTSSGSTPQTADGDDKASALAYGAGQAYPTTVTVYVCYNWAPPMAGFLFVPSNVTLRAVITEAMQRQQGGS